MSRGRVKERVSQARAWHRGQRVPVPSAETTLGQPRQSKEPLFRGDIEDAGPRGHDEDLGFYPTKKSLRETSLDSDMV